MMHFLRFFAIILNIQTVLNQILETLQQLEPKAQTNEKVWMDAYEVKSYFNIHRSTLYRWKREKILCPAKVGRKDMYLRSEVEKVIKESRLQSFFNF
ncbi:helix-turn-helix domain-containing protein [Pedobacter glucosidilyticus]|uniref:helix-turn-helix domain-containing protein n=1 Tax=Pedobacter glucosidilyticus TaxID=1122941 RepID=UPI0009DBE030|nr:helix-turn-helix domain-containing protein [Pedobacter glucosidilyticus]